MALQKQILPINFNGGLDTKTDPKTVIPGKLLELKNGVFKKANRISKRNGYDALSTSIEGGGHVTDGAALGVFNNELSLYTGNKLYTRLEANNKWIDKGAVNSVILKSTIAANSIDQLLNPVVATNGGITVYAYRRGSDVYYSVIDQFTGATIVTSTKVKASATTRAPQVVAFQNSILIFYGASGGSNLYYRKLDIANPSLLGTEVNFASDLNATVRYDAITIGDKVFVTYYNAVSTTSIRTLDTSYSISGATVVATSSSTALSTFSDDQQNLWVACAAATAVKYFVRSYTLSSVVGVTAIETAAATVSLIGGAIVGTTAKIFWSIIPTLPSTSGTEYTRFCTIVGAAITVAAADFKRSVGLASKPFVVDGLIMVPTLHESPLQPTYFIIREDGTTIAKVTPNNGGNLTPFGTLSAVPEYETGKFIFASGIQTRLESAPGFNNYPRTVIAVNSTVLDFVSGNKFLNSQMGELYIVGGFLQSYDGGGRVVEDNFHLFPEDLDSSTNTTGGDMEPGTYQYSAIYEWTDALGQVHRSAPSIAITQVVPAGTSTNTVSVVIPTLRVTAKTDVSIVLFRTESLGTTFYRVGSIANSTTSDSVTITDTLADTDILSQELLYTTGGVIENIAPPSCSLITTYKNRIFLSGLEDPLAFQYSKLRINGTPVEFTDSFIGRVDSRGGPITAQGAMDDYVIFFKENSLFAFSGNGPNDTGTQSDYQSPVLISTDVGCSDPNSVVITPDGLIFKSAKGLCLLNRSLQTSYIGAEVEDYNDLEITSSQLIATENQVRFTTNSSIVLMYDYFFGQWSTFTNLTGEDSAFWNGRFTFVKANGEVWVESDGYMDNGQAIVLSLATAWMSLAGLQGFQRIYRMIVLGEYESPHKLSVEIGYDFNPNYSQFANIDVNSIYPVTTYGEDSPYGEGTPYGGAYPLYQFKTHLTHQKCEALRFRFSDNQNAVTGDYGASFNITNMALEVGVKKGVNKGAISNNFATT
jgi:hypothetical protein